MERHDTFVTFLANGVAVAGHTEPTIKAGASPPGEWIHCRQLTYGLKRESSIPPDGLGQLLYEHIRLECSQGPGTPQLMDALRQGAAISATIRTLVTSENGHQEQTMLIQADGGHLVEVIVSNRSAVTTDPGEALMCVVLAPESVAVTFVGKGVAASETAVESESKDLKVALQGADLQITEEVTAATLRAATLGAKGEVDQ